MSTITKQGRGARGSGGSTQKKRERDKLGLRGKGSWSPQGSHHGNVVECLGDRKNHDGHLAKKFLKKYYS